MSSVDSSDDTLRRYLDDIRKTQPIDRKAEQLLFKKLDPKDPNFSELDARRAREMLIRANMRFVLKVALQYRGCPIPLPDLVSEGAMGLIRAIESFDHSRGLKFISYAVWWIKAYITRAINEQGSLIRLPANQHLRVRKALKNKSKGEELTDEIRELIQLGEAGISFDAPLKADTKTTYQEVLADPRAANPEHDAEINSVELMAHELLNELPKREKDVLKGLFGIDHETPQTLREVGESLQISHERVRQLRDQALRRIKKARNREVLREKYEAYIAALS